MNNLDKLDSFSDEIMKNSFVAKLFSIMRARVNLAPTGIIPYLLIISIYFLLICLCLPYFAEDRTGIGLIILLTFFLFLLNLFSNKSLVVQFNSIDFLILVFILISAMSTFSSYFLKESLLGFIKYLLYFLLYFVIKITMMNRASASLAPTNLFIFLCVGASIISAIGIWQYISGVEPLATWEDPNIENIHTRVYSTLGNPNLLAGYLLLMLPVSVFLPVNLKQKLLILAGSVIMFCCLILTGSRGGYIGLITISLFLFIIFLVRQKRLKSIFFYLILFILLILALTFMFPIFTERISTIFTFREHSSNNFRINVWSSCLEMLKDNFLTGIGPGNSTFREVYGLYMKNNFDALSAYNIFLEIGIETGILGCIAFILIFVLSLLKLHYLFWQKGNLFALGIFLSLVGVLIHGMTDTVFFRPQIFIPFWFLIASIAKLDMEEKERQV